ncbi:hypothetical protein ACH5RR_018565 [Cinchona calisaya]|uniref:RING-type domain-containing protein n=1 Tax=Cinchona calisaya TaxID=153742 RepID=A0ABD2ZLT5_9GENT
MGFCDSGMVGNGHFVLCKAALIIGIIRRFFSFAQKLVKHYMQIFSWFIIEYHEHEPTIQSSSSALSIELKDHLSLTTFENIKERLPSHHEMSCVVCLKRFKEKNQVWELSNCRHVFHKNCLDRWLLYDARLTCPLCRTCLITMHSESSSIMPLQQQPSWAVERILYLFGDDLLCSSSYSSGIEDHKYSTCLSS